MKKIKLEFQYFDDCPNHQKMYDNLESALKGLEGKIVLKKVLVEDEADAKKVSFRGSPTLLIDSEDLEGIQAPENPALACRYYPKGIPSSEEIRKKVIKKIEKLSAQSF